MLDLYEEFSLLVNEFENSSIEYALCGGLAVSVHGFVRATIDIDFVVLAEDIDKIWNLVRRLGYLVEAVPMVMSKGMIKIYRYTKIEQDSGDFISLDCLVLSEELNSLWDKRERLPFENGFVKVLNKSALIELKMLRNSFQDKQDIQNLKGETDETN